MKYLNSNSIFCIILISIFTTGCSDYNETNAIIIGSTYNPLIGNDWQAKSWYKFEVDDKTFIDTIYFYNGDKMLVEGDLIKIDYNTENPTEHQTK